MRWVSGWLRDELLILLQAILNTSARLRQHMYVLGCTRHLPALALHTVYVAERQQRRKHGAAIHAACSYNDHLAHRLSPATGGPCPHLSATGCRANVVIRR